MNFSKNSRKKKRLNAKKKSIQEEKARSKNKMIHRFSVAIRNGLGLLLILTGIVGMFFETALFGFSLLIFGVTITNLIETIADKKSFLIKKRQRKLLPVLGLLFVLLASLSLPPANAENQTVSLPKPAPTAQEPTPSANEPTAAPKRTEEESATVSNAGDPPDPSAVLETANQDSFEGYTLMDVSACNLSGSREANAVVDIGYGDREYWAFTNEYGQLVKVIADEIIPQKDDENINSSGRYCSDEAKVPGTEQKEYDEGHVIADSLGGVSNAYNITPQNSALNRYGTQAYMEKVIREAGGCTDFTAIITYPDSETAIPNHYSFTYTINGNVIHDEFDNVDPEAKEPETLALYVKSNYTSDAWQIEEGETVGTYFDSQTNDNRVPSLTYVSSDENIAVVDSNGNIKGISKGTATITASEENGISDEVVVRVNKKPTAQPPSNPTASHSASSSQANPSSESMVWKSATGSKYHAIPNCGRMNPDKATQITQSEAERLGLERCSKCW